MNEPKILKRTEFGNPILRSVTNKVPVSEITGAEIQNLILDMQYTVAKRKLGVGIAAPQVGVDLALALIAIKKTKNRPNAKEFTAVIINPEIIQTYGYRTGMWEGCLSGGDFFAKAMRYKKVRLQWYDETGKKHDEMLEGLPAHVAQHEVDHLNGILFVDRVKDSKTYMTGNEYRKKVVAERKNKSKK